MGEFVVQLLLMIHANCTTAPTAMQSVISIFIQVQQSHSYGHVKFEVRWEREKHCKAKPMLLSIA